jgi:hypothetical protein
MKIMKVALRFWMALTSVCSFLVGWAMLAHAAKPVQAKSAPASASSLIVTPLPTLAPLPSLDLSGTSSSSGLLVPQVNIQAAPLPVFSQAPVFSSGGSKCRRWNSAR